jgi:hypothetical protein
MAFSISLIRSWIKFGISRGLVTIQAHITRYTAPSLITLALRWHYGASLLNPPIEPADTAPHLAALLNTWIEVHFVMQPMLA